MQGTASNAEHRRRGTTDGDINTFERISRGNSFPHQTTVNPSGASVRLRPVTVTGQGKDGEWGEGRREETDREEEMNSEQERILMEETETAEVSRVLDGSQTSARNGQEKGKGRRKPAPRIKSWRQMCVSIGLLRALLLCLRLLSFFSPDLIESSDLIFGPINPPWGAAENISSITYGAENYIAKGDNGSKWSGKIDWTVCENYSFNILGKKKSSMSSEEYNCGAMQQFIVGFWTSISLEITSVIFLVFICPGISIDSFKRIRLIQTSFCLIAAFYAVFSLVTQRNTEITDAGVQIGELPKKLTFWYESVGLVLPYMVEIPLIYLVLKLRLDDVKYVDVRYVLSRSLNKMRSSSSPYIMVESVMEFEDNIFSKSLLNFIRYIQLVSIVTNPLLTAVPVFWQNYFGWLRKYFVEIFDLESLVFYYENWTPLDRNEIVLYFVFSMIIFPISIAYVYLVYCVIQTYIKNSHQMFTFAESAIQKSTEAFSRHTKLILGAGFLCFFVSMGADLYLYPGKGYYVLLATGPIWIASLVLCIYALVVYNLIKASLEWALLRRLVERGIRKYPLIELEKDEAISDQLLVGTICLGAVYLMVLLGSIFSIFAVNKLVWAFHKWGDWGFCFQMLLGWVSLFFILVLFIPDDGVRYFHKAWKRGDPDIDRYEIDYFLRGDIEIRADESNTGTFRGYLKDSYIFDSILRSIPRLVDVRYLHGELLKEYNANSKHFAHAIFVEKVVLTLLALTSFPEIVFLFQYGMALVVDLWYPFKSYKENDKEYTTRFSLLMMLILEILAARFHGWDAFAGFLMVLVSLWMGLIWMMQFQVVPRCCFSLKIPCICCFCCNCCCFSTSSHREQRSLKLQTELIRQKTSMDTYIKADTIEEAKTKSKTKQSKYTTIKE